VQWRVNAAATKVKSTLRHTRRNLTRLNEGDIVHALQDFGEFTQSTLCVHSSLSACGNIKGGPQTVVDSLRAWIGSDRTLVMVTHTYCYPDENGSVPVYDPAATPSRVGAISDYFWRQPGVRRSIHPTHSIAAIGPLAEELCADHELCDTPCGRGTPYEKLLQHDASVLMFGATMNTYTLYHTAEAAAKVPYLYEPNQYTLQIKDANGAVKPFLMWRQDFHVARSFAERAAWLEQRGLLKRQKLRRGELLLIPHSLDVHRGVVEELAHNPNFLLDNNAREKVLNRPAR
jgi:aminoglycoside 3-N-acetyltransferase